MATERVLSNLNLISFKTEGGLQNHIDELQDGDLVFTPDNSLKGNLFDFKWADHLLNDMSWLRADTFSWHDGEMYKAAYNHLVADFEGTTEETETIGDTAITFYRAEDGHKICLPDQEDKLLELYNKTGVAWYYILDTKNKQFKLPRTKFGFTGLRDEVGGYVEAGLPDHTHTLKGLWRYNGNNNNALGDGGDNSTVAKLQDAIMPASENNPIYGNSETVQPPATQMYLYFYVGNFERDAVEQTAGVTVETLNGKADSDLGNIPANYDYVVESQLPTAENGYTWYRKYKSGWVEQGGYTKIVKVALPVEMLNSKEYTALVQYNPVDGDISNGAIIVENKTTTGFDVQRYSSGTDEFSWQVSGIAQG